MKPARLLRLLFLFCIAACGSPQPAQDADTNNTAGSVPVTAITATVKDSFPQGKIIDSIICKTDPSQSYALYVPAQKKKEALPLVYCFDPHGDGALPLRKYKALADQYGYILIGSNNSKNGNDWPTTAQVWNSLFSDTQKRLTFNSNRIYTCGFSGGAKAASYVALHYSEIKGVIANSAGLPDGTPAGNFNFSFSFTGVAGNGDMNRTDLVALNNALDSTPTRHRLILFDGKHEWMPAAAMNLAFCGLELDAMYSKLVPVNDSLIAAYVNESKKKVSGYLQISHLVQAAAECHLSINLLNGIGAEVNWFKDKEDSVVNDVVYKKQLQQEANLFTIEQSKKEEYAQQFQQGDLQYWAATINRLQQKAAAHTAEGNMYQRLLAYLSLAFYSISNGLILNNQNDAAQHFVTLYKMADATNPEAWYFSAVLNARNNNTAAATADLIKAAGSGFTDTNRMLRQPEFQQPSSPVHFEEVKKKMRREE